MIGRHLPRCRLNCCKAGGGTRRAYVSHHLKCSCLLYSFEGTPQQRNPVAIAEWFHLFPSRTQSLSTHTSKVLGWRRPGRIESCWLMTHPQGCVFYGDLPPVLHEERCFSQKEEQIHPKVGFCQRFSKALIFYRHFHDIIIYRRFLFHGFFS